MKARRMRYEADLLDHAAAETAAGGGAWEPVENVLIAARFKTGGLGAGVHRLTSIGTERDGALPSNGYYFVNLLTASAGDTLDVSDEPGFINPDPFEDVGYWDATFPAGTTLKLPKGLYRVGLSLTLDAAPSVADKRIFPDLDVTAGYDDTPLGALYSAIGDENIFMALNTSYFSGAKNRLITQDVVAPRDDWVLAPYVYRESGADASRKIEYFVVKVFKVR